MIPKVYDMFKFLTQILIFLFAIFYKIFICFGSDLIKKTSNKIKTEFLIIVFKMLFFYWKNKGQDLKKSTHGLML